MTQKLVARGLYEKKSMATSLAAGFLLSSGKKGSEDMVAWWRDSRPSRFFWLLDYLNVFCWLYAFSRVCYDLLVFLACFVVFLDVF